MTKKKNINEFFPENQDDGDEHYIDNSGSFPIRRKKKNDGKAKDDDGENVIVIV
jgi:hypothetical protein